MNKEQIQDEYKRSYDKGLLNHAVRAWFYLQRGLNLVNEFKYLGAGIFAIYYTLKLQSPVILLILFFVSVPILIFAGYFHTFKMAKALEWTNMMFSSYFGRYSMDLSEKNVALLEEIKNILQKKS